MCAVIQGIGYFPKNGLSKQGNFSGAGCQNMFRGEILLDRDSPMLVFWRLLLTKPFQASGIIEGKISGAG